MTYSATLTRGNVKTILKALKHNRWSVAPLGARHGYAAKPPSGVGTVRFSQTSPRKQVVEDFESFGLTLALNGLGTPRFTHTPSMESLAPLVNTAVAQQKPLIDIPESVLRSWEFSTHAFERMNERNIGYFEVMAALHRPDRIGTRPDDGPESAHYFRGDVEVIVSKSSMSVITVIDVLKDYRTTPRVALAPEVTPIETPAPPEEIPVAKKQAFDFNSYSNKSEAIRQWLKQFPAGTKVTREQLCEALPGELRSAENRNWSALADIVITRCYRVGSMRRITMGEYEIIDPELVTQMVLPKKNVTTSGLEKSLAVRRGEIPSAISMIRAAVNAAKPGTVYTSASVVEDLALDCTHATANAALRKLQTEGVLSLMKNTLHGTHQYRKPRPEKPTPVVFSHLEPRPDDIEAKPPVVRSTRAKTLPSRTTVPEEPEDYDVHVGFHFVSELPKSDVFELVDIVHRHMPELDATPWGWAQIATYSGGRATETAEKRAAKLEADLNDPLLKFEVRRVSTTEVGLFVARGASGGRGAHT